MIQKTVLGGIRAIFGHFAKERTEILLRDLNKKLGRENVSKPTIWNGNLYEDNDDNSFMWIMVIIVI
jgi:hypothetical protein